MLQQIEKDQDLIEMLVVETYSLFPELDTPNLVTESVSELKQTLKLIIQPNKPVPQHLAAALAKIMISLQRITELIDRKKRYKKHSLMQKILDVASRHKAIEIKQALEDDNLEKSTLSVFDEIDNVLKSLVGYSHKVEEIRDSFENIKRKITTETTEKTRLSIMKLTSKLIQSNTDSSLRTDIIVQYLE